MGSALNLIKMNREIKFRGKCTQSRKWIYGYYFHIPKPVNVSQYFIQSGINRFSVFPETIGQFTGSKDKNGKEIYEGDIVKRIAEIFNFEELDETKRYTNEEEVSVIEYRSNGFWVKNEGFGWEGENLWDWEQMEVVGNIFENPELLKEQGL
jgi:uncharacterized phage protein (TIGR01671 family)